MKIVLADLHEHLIAADLPILAVRRTHEQKIEMVFTDEATEDQRKAAELMVREYDQEAVDEQKPKPVTTDEINSAKSLADVKALMIRMYEIKG